MQPKSPDLEKAEGKTDFDDACERVPTKDVGEVTVLDPADTQRGLKSRHAQMIALGGTIGTGVFVGSGQALHMGGPLFLLLSYSLLTILVFGIVTATTEFSSYLPVPGSSIAYYGDRFFSKSMGFALGWFYWYIFTITVPSEITAANLVIEYWNPPAHPAIWISIILVVIVALNCFPVHVYGETEFWFASLKVIGILGLLIMALVVTCGGGPKGEVIGFAYWKDPGPVNEYLVGGAGGRLVSFVATWCFSVYAFAFAPELLVVTGGEMENPRRNLPTAGRRFFYRLVVFYVLSAFLIGLIVPSNDDQLLGGGAGAGASPWAVAAKNAGIKGLDSVINAVILLSAWSAGNSWLYLASRALYSMAVYGTAPKIFKRCTPSGIPYMAIAGSSIFSALAYLNISKSTATVFNWFVNLVNSSGYISWVCVCVIYIRFRKATFAQGITELPYRSIVQPYAAYICGSIFLTLLLLNGLSVFLRGHWDSFTFITSYIGIPIFFCLYFGHRIFAGKGSSWVIPADEVDLHSGLAEVLEAESPSFAGSLKWYQKWRLLFE